MAVSYNGLWKLLIDNNMKKMDLVERVGISSSTLAKMSKGKIVSLTVLEKICDELGHVLAQGLAGRLLLLSDTAVQADGYLRTEVSFFFRHGDSPFLDGKASISKALWNSYSQKATKKLCKRKRNGHAPPQNFWWPSAGRSGIIRVTF